MSDAVFDLLGHPVSPRLGLKGRPRHKATDEKRLIVSRLHREGLSHLAIADRLGISAPTLRLNYFQELESSSQAHRRRGGGSKVHSPSA